MGDWPCFYGAKSGAQNFARYGVTGCWGTSGNRSDNGNLNLARSKRALQVLGGAQMDLRVIERACAEQGGHYNDKAIGGVGNRFAAAGGGLTAARRAA